MTAGKYRITFLLDRPTLSGGVRVIADYARSLSECGHVVRLVARPVERIALTKRIKAFALGRPQPRGRGDTTFLDPLGDLVSYLPGDAPARAADVPDGDVIVATFWTTAASVAAMPPPKGVKAYFMQDYGAAGQPIEEIKRTWSLGLKIITINEALKTAAEEISGAPTRLVPCGVENLFVRAKPRAMRKGPPTVGFVFSNNEMKGSRHCIEAIAIARRTKPDLHAVSFGPSAPRAPSPPLPDFIDFRAGVSDPEAKAIYESADVWLFGSINEGFGLPILEAMASGTPVVAARSAAAPDILRRGGGLLVDIAKPEEMAAAILKICAMAEDQWTALSRQAQETAAQFSQDAARRNFEAALIDAIEGRWNGGI